MKDLQIEKALNMLKEQKLEDLRLYLQGLYFKSEDNNKVKLFETVKKYLKNTDNTRPILKTIQNSKVLNCQFICDGYTAYIFRNHIKELDELPNSTDGCIAIEQIIRQNQLYSTLKKDEEILLKNISKYIKWFKTLDIYNKDTKVVIYFRDRVFNANYFNELVKITGLKSLTIQDLDNPLRHNALQFDNDEIYGLILPLRFHDKKDKTADMQYEEIKNITQQFIENMKNGVNNVE